MELEELLALVPDYGKTVEQISALETEHDKDISKYQDQYNPKGHPILDTALRPDKIIKADTIDANGNATAESTTSVAVARLPVPIQKKIVALAAAFLCGHPIQLDCNPKDKGQEDLLAVIKKTWDDNKLDYYSKKLAKLMMAETKVAEIWYVENAEEGYWADTPNQNAKFRLRVKILSYKAGDKLYPVFNANGDMIAFGRAYVVKVGDSNEDHFDLYTDAKNYLGKKPSGGQWEVKPEANAFGKIPIIYYTQEIPEWNDVQEMIERIEKLISNHADTNDYNGSPIVVIKGEIKSFSKKGETGKVVELSGENASAEYMSWDQSPESLKLEHEHLSRWIMFMTSTPDISFETMKAIGALSGSALKLLFLDAHLKASDKEETFGVGIQRRINFLKAAMVKINTAMEKGQTLSIKPKFEYYLPKDEKEIIDMLLAATGSSKAVLSQKTAVALNPLVKDPDIELDNIDAEKAEAQQQIEGGFNQ
jgi:SPP1 family phage portal protein